MQYIALIIKQWENIINTIFYVWFNVLKEKTYMLYKYESMLILFLL